MTSSSTRTSTTNVPSICTDDSDSRLSMRVSRSSLSTISPMGRRDETLSGFGLGGNRSRVTRLHHVNGIGAGRNSRECRRPRVTRSVRGRHRGIDHRSQRVLAGPECVGLGRTDIDHRDRTPSGHLPNGRPRRHRRRPAIDDRQHALSRRTARCVGCDRSRDSDRDRYSHPRTPADVGTGCVSTLDRSGSRRQQCRSDHHVRRTTSGRTRRTRRRTVATGCSGRLGGRRRHASARRDHHGARGRPLACRRVGHHHRIAARYATHHRAAP